MNVYLTESEYSNIVIYVRNKLYDKCQFACLSNKCKNISSEIIPCMELSHLENIGNTLVDLLTNWNPDIFSQYEDYTEDELIKLKCPFVSEITNYNLPQYTSVPSFFESCFLYEIFLTYCTYLEKEYRHDNEMKKKLLDQLKDFLLKGNVYEEMHSLFHNKIREFDGTGDCSKQKSDLANLLISETIILSDNKYVDFINALAIIINSMTIDKLNFSPEKEFFELVFKYLCNSKD